jgi:uncharacterized membrane-anchored protein
MRQLLAVALFVLATLLPALPASAQEEKPDPVSQLPWQFGPTVGRISDRATIKVPEGYAFLGAEGTRKLDEIFENPPVDVDQYTIAPKTLDWVAYFTFNPIGFVKDDETLDADELLSTIREGTEQGNVERRKRGWDTLQITGWSFKPQYDKQLKALEWAVNAELEQTKSQVVNYNTRLLGRRGVMEVTVVAEPAKVQPAIAAFKGLMPGYAFASGEKYAEFKAGDHVAEIGLAALITGGAAAVATKKGLFAAIGIALLKFWKLLVIGIGGIGMWIRKRTRGDGSVVSK